jgi:hypothetical protein
MDDWLHRQFDPQDGKSDQGVWQVHIVLIPTEVDEVRKFAPVLIPAENFEIHTELDEAGNEGAIIFAIRVDADTANDATVAASWRLNKIREAAGLRRKPPIVVGYISPQWRKDTAGQMGKEAVDLLKQRRDALAVIRAQTTCELLIAETFKKLIAIRFPDFESERLVRRPATLSDKASLALLELLTGRRIQDENWWPAYVEHRTRRNAIVHSGVSVVHEDAQASIGTMNDLHAWLLDARDAADSLPRSDRGEDLQD